MEYERIGVTLTWQIENFEFICKKFRQYYSPVFSVDVMDGTKWRLGFHEGTLHRPVSLNIRREKEDNGPEELELDFELSVSVFDGTNSTDKQVNSFTFQKGSECQPVKMNAKEINPFTIRCKIYKSRGSFSKAVNFFARTRMTTEKSIFRGIVQNFEDFSDVEKKTLKIVSSSTGEKLITINLVLTSHYSERTKKNFTQVQIEFIPSDKQILHKQCFYFKLFILNTSGNKTDIGQLARDISLLTSIKLPLYKISKEYIKENAALYLVDDALSLHCELTFYPEIEYEKVERFEYVTDSIDDVKQTDLSTALEILISKNDVPSNTKLETETETISAHISILSAQSPVFEAMFKTDMKETKQKCVKIGDVDAKTLKRMLLFLYSDSIEELGWKDVMKLYVAADKYLIQSLKNRCIALLEQSSDLSNCCVLLYFSHMHQEEVLKKAMENFVSNCQNQVVFCDEWRDLEQNHPHLAIDYIRHRYL